VGEGVKSSGLPYVKIGFSDLSHFTFCPSLSHRKVTPPFEVNETVHRDATMKITNKMHYID
jgi:hypothetical protein